METKTIINTPEAQDEEKVYLESLLLPEVVALMGLINSEYSKAVRSNQEVNFDVYKYQDNFERAIAKHYKRVTKSFGSIIRDDANLKEIKESQEFNDLVDSQIIEDNLSRVPERAKILLETTERQINEATATAIIDTDSEEDAKEQMLTQVKQSLDGRVEMITETENNIYCEEVKNSEAQGCMDFIYITGLAMSVKKRWTSLMDGKTRKHHAAANGQVKELHEPFIVHNQELMFPGDTARGATLDNIVRCRCTVMYVLHKN